MSSADAKAGEKVDFEVLEEVKLGDVVIVQHGAMAIGTVTEAQPKRRMGRAGKLNINIDYVQLVSGEKAPLRAVKGGSGGNHTGAMTGAMVATGILFFPAAPFFLFMHGKDITISERHRGHRLYRRKHTTRSGKVFTASSYQPGCQPTTDSRHLPTLNRFHQVGPAGS